MNVWLLAVCEVPYAFVFDPESLFGWLLERVLLRSAFGRSRLRRNGIGFELVFGLGGRWAGTNRTLEENPRIGRREQKQRDEFRIGNLARVAARYAEGRATPPSDVR